MENQEIKVFTLEEAIKIACTKGEVLPARQIWFTNTLNRVLAQDVFSDTDLPPYNKSSMDGYACRREDLGNELRVLEVVAAGSSPTIPVTKNTCSKIMTGAEVPEGADTVIMVEYTEPAGSGAIRFVGEKTASNICLTGEDLKKGSLVLSKGTLIQPQHLAMLASVGCTNPVVYSLPSIGIVSTGSELVEPGELLNRSKIRNSNGHQLIAQATKMGLQATYLGIVPDDFETTLFTIKKSVSENTVTIISGGVSVGDFDYVPAAIEKAGFEILIKKLSVKPGQHTTFAVKRIGQQKKYIIGLPGNPVSSFIQFEIFVKPFLLHLMGAAAHPVVFPVRLAHSFYRRKTDRVEFLPVILNSQNEAELVRYNGSAHLHAYHQALGFITVDKGTSEIKEGETVYVRPL